MKSRTHLKPRDFDLNRCATLRDTIARGRKALRTYAWEGVCSLRTLLSIETCVASGNISASTRSEALAQARDILVRQATSHGTPELSSEVLWIETVC